MYEVITQSSLYIQGFHQKNISIFSLVEYTWHIFESNVTLRKVGFKSYLNLEKSTWNLLLQCKIKKLMHNNEEVSCYSLFT